MDEIYWIKYSIQRNSLKQPIQDTNQEDEDEEESNEIDLHLILNEDECTLNLNETLNEV